MMLDEIIAYKRKQLEAQRHDMPLSVLERELQHIPRCRDFVGALKGSRNLKGDGVKIIAEIKRASPSKGVIRDDIAPADIATLYQDGGADAISVLTEDKYFMGCDQFIQEVKGVVSCPVLRKDFIIDEYQLYQSKVLGADAVLLIVAAVGIRLKAFYSLARSLGMECLVEVHDEREIEIALGSGARVIGINNRDLKNFNVSLKTTERLIKLISGDVVKVSESGIKSVYDINHLKCLGVDAFLIGETLMKANDIAGALKTFKGG